MTPENEPNWETPATHQVKNYLSVILGFADLLLLELPEDDRKRADVAEILKAAHAALALVPSLSQDAGSGDTSRRTPPF